MILDLLLERPRHGYDIIRELEERFHGFYSPSPGSVYPTLQLLSDQGLVTSIDQDSKRVYSITDAGRRWLAERSEAARGARERSARGRGWPFGPEMQQLVEEVRQLGEFMFRQGASGAFTDPNKMRLLREALSRARRDIETIFRDEPPAQGTPL